MEIDPLIKALLARQFAPSNAQKNSDITREEIENALQLTEHWGKFFKVNASGNGIEFVSAEPGAAYDGDPTVIVQDDEHLFHTLAQANDWDGKADDNHNHDLVYEPLKGADDNYVTDAEKTKLSNLSGTNSGDQDLSGLMVKANNLSDLTNASTARTNLGINTTANQTDSADKRFCTDAQKTVIGNTSGTNTGDETGAGIRTKLGTTSIGVSLNTLTNPSAITFLRVNADNTVTARTAAEFKTDLGVTGDDIVYAPTLADVAINNVADVTVQTKDLTGIVAGDQVIIEGEFIILNNSTATRVYIITIDFDNAFDIEFTTPALATSSTLMHPFMFRAVCNVRSTSLAYCLASLDMQLAAGIGTGGDTTMAATHLSCKGWGESSSNLTGTLTCNLKIRSANNTATQTYRPVSFTIRKTSPIG